MGDRLLYATPTGKHPHPGYVTSMRDLEMSCRTFERRPEDFQMACGPVQMARSEIAERACNGSCTVRHDHREQGGAACKIAPYDFVLMHDDDLVINSFGPLGNPIDVWHEVFAKNREVAIIGGVYLREKMETPTIVMPHPEYPEENCHVAFGLPLGLFEVAGVGTGFIMVRGSALRELRAKEDGAHSLFRFPFNPTRWGTVNHTGEDYDFCSRIRALGYKVLVDTRFETQHIKESGSLHYQHDQYEAQWLDAPANWSEYDRKVHNAAAKARTESLMRAVVPGITPIVCNGVMCLDHVPLLIAEGKARAEKLAAAAAAAKKEAA